jgi:transposase
MSLEVKYEQSNQTKSPKYTLEFKMDAARLVIEKGYTHDQAAELN